MGYDLKPRNKQAGGFHMGAFSFPVLLEVCNHLFPCIQGRGWYCVFGKDPRMGDGRYPRILSMDGFRVTAEEARIMARMARNYVAIQRTLPEPKEDDTPLFERRVMDEEWPKKIRTDFVDSFEQFAEWADKSRGFAIW